MEIKSVYLDLQKAEPMRKWNKTVWKVESEAFKDPLELQIGYDDKELESFNNAVKELKVELNNKDSQIHELSAKLDAQAMLISDFLWTTKWLWNAIGWLHDEIKSYDDEVTRLYKVVADQKTTIETLSWAILKMQDKNKEIDKRLTKQPVVCNDKTFISWQERVWLGMVEIPSGNYLLISHYHIVEHNEYVENEDDLTFDIINVSDNIYIPTYQLYWGTELDTPTATIYRDLVFIPC